MSYNCILFLILVVISGALALPADPVPKRPSKNVYYHLNVQDKSVSCLIFKEANTGREFYINITSGCYSDIHYQNRVPEQNHYDAKIEDGCFQLYVVVHEYLHVLDFLNHFIPNGDDLKIIRENFKKRLVAGKDDPIAHKYRLNKKDVKNINNMIKLPNCKGKPSSH